MLIVLTALALLRYELPPSVCYGHVRSSDWTFEAGSGNAACWDTSGVLVLLARTSAPAERPERFLVLFFGFAQQLSVAMAAQLKAAREVQSADKRDEPDGSGDRSDDDPSGARLWNEWLANFAPRGNGDPVPASETNSEPNTAATEIETETDHTYSHGTDDTEAETTHDETPETTETTEATETSEKPLDDNVVALGFKCEAGALAVLTLSQSPYNFEFPLNSRSLLSVDEASSRPAHTMDVDLFVAIVRMALDGFAYIHGFLQDALFQQTLQPTLIVQAT